MKITLVIFSLSCGGAERVMSILSNYWAERGDQIAIITIDSQDADFYSLSKNIQRVALNSKSNSSNVFIAIKNNVKRLRKLRIAIKQTSLEVVVSFTDRTNVLSIIAAIGLTIPIIVSEHTDPRQLPAGGVWNILRRLTYLRANAVVVLNNELRDVVSKFVPKKRLYVIPNPALTIRKNQEYTLPFQVPSPFIVAMGRLVKLKGFDILIEAFARCNRGEWFLVILGEGKERKSLCEQVKKLGLESKVLLPGNVHEPSVILSRADIFVLSSRIEGFPMAILEAMSCGLPVISFDCPTGPSEIIRDGIDGVLVPKEDTQALAAAMSRLIENKDERKKIAEKAREVIKRFSLEEVILRWDNLLRKVIGEI